MVSTTLFKFDFAGFVNIGWFTAITLIITFCMIDMFDTIGTLVGTASRAGMVDKDGNMPKRALPPVPPPSPPSSSPLPALRPAAAPV